jgi:hypothetical protein
MFAGDFTALARVCDSRLIFALNSSGLSEFLLLTAEYALGVKSFGLKAWAALHASRRSRTPFLKRKAVGKPPQRVFL